MSERDRQSEEQGLHHSSLLIEEIGSEDCLGMAWLQAMHETQQEGKGKSKGLIIHGLSKLPSKLK
jgi:hypothetical protein